MPSIPASSHLIFPFTSFLFDPFYVKCFTFRYLFCEELKVHPMTRMCITHWLCRDISNFIMLLLVTSAPSDLSSAKMRKGCNNKIVIPEIDISTSPPNRTLTIGAAISLTCIARPRNGDRLFPRRQTKYIQWYDPQGKPVGARCLQGTPAVRKLSCRLMLQRVTLEQFGNYTCEAENDYVGYCRQSTVEIKLRGM